MTCEGGMVSGLEGPLPMGPLLLHTHTPQAFSCPFPSQFPFQPFQHLCLFREGHI